MAVKVTVWNERALENNETAAEIYPKGKHNTIKDFLSLDSGLDVTVSDMDRPEQGLSAELLENTDVLIYWGHNRNKELTDEANARIVKRVLEGMGFIVLHSAHMSKPFTTLMGTEGILHWGADMKEIVWTVMPGHPIARGIPEYFVLEKEEMYGEPFDIPPPDELIFISWFKDGYVFRSGCAYHRGNGKVFYFQPGHESLPSFHNENVQKIITNACHWAAPNGIKQRMKAGQSSKMVIDFNE